MASTPEVVGALNRPWFVRSQGALPSGGLLCADATLVHTESARGDNETSPFPSTSWPASSAPPTAFAYTLR